MSDVTGPISTLPGSIYALPVGATCDDHPNKLAVARIQGETDSFGSEMYDVCQECLDEIRGHKDIGACDWCKRREVELNPRKDIDEGLHGRVYYICSDCLNKDVARVKREYEESESCW